MRLMNSKSLFTYLGMCELINKCAGMWTGRGGIPRLLRARKIHCQYWLEVIDFPNGLVGRLQVPPQAGIRRNVAGGRHVVMVQNPALWGKWLLKKVIGKKLGASLAIEPDEFVLRLLKPGRMLMVEATHLGSNGIASSPSGRNAVHRRFKTWSTAAKYGWLSFYIAPPPVSATHSPGTPKIGQVSKLVRFRLGGYCCQLLIRYGCGFFLGILKNCSGSKYCLTPSPIGDPCSFLNLSSSKSSFILLWLMQIKTEHTDTK